jgi:site-specific recombinase XerD
MDTITRQFEEQLVKSGTSQASLEVHLRRVSTYLNWCRDVGTNPLEKKTPDEFLRSREDKRLREATIKSYEFTLKTFSQYMIK